jgi:Tfp pilus assembly protein PilV
MRGILKRTSKRRGQAGISLIELMIAGVILVVGVLALMALVITAIGTNNRNKKDTTATLLAQMVLQQMSTLPANSTDTISITDCAGNTWNIGVAPGGATVSGAQIDFSATTVTNYNMQYTVCAGNVQTRYDVRWNVQQLTTATSLVTVGVRQLGAVSDLRYFALPVTIRTILGA